MKTLYQVALTIATLSRCNVFKVAKNSYTLNDRSSGGYRGEISADNLTACGYVAMQGIGGYEVFKNQDND